MGEEQPSHQPEEIIDQALQPKPEEAPPSLPSPEDQPDHYERDPHQQATQHLDTSQPHTAPETHGLTPRLRDHLTNPQTKAEVRDAFDAVEARGNLAALVEAIELYTHSPYGKNADLSYAPVSAP